MTVRDKVFGMGRFFMPVIVYFKFIALAPAFRMTVRVKVSDWEIGIKGILLWVLTCSIICLRIGRFFMLVEVWENHQSSDVILNAAKDLLTLSTYSIGHLSSDEEILHAG